MSRRRRLTDVVEPTMLAAVVAGPPADDEGLTVRIPDLDDGEFRHGPFYGWAHRSDDREPQRDDPCTVYEDSTGGLWIGNWRPKEE